MAWIELHQPIWTHRKTLILADALDLPPMYAAAHMIHLWTWALDNAQGGDLTGLPARVIATGAGWDGDPGRFVDAAVNAGYLDRGEGLLLIHDWDDYAGRLIERREQQRERMRQTRSKTLASRAHNVRSTKHEREHLPYRTVPNQQNDDDDDSAPTGDEQTPEPATPDPDTAKAECMELINRSRPDWALSGDRFRDLLAYEDRLPWAVIRTAVDKTLVAGAKDLKYCLVILDKYVEKRVRSPADVEALDVAFEAEKQTRARASPGKGKGGGKPPPSSNVILRRDKKDESDYSYIYEKFTS